MTKPDGVQLLERLELRSNATQRAAIERLERAGLRIGRHFGLNNCIEIVEELDEAIKTGTSFRWMRMWGVSE